MEEQHQCNEATPTNNNYNLKTFFGGCKVSLFRYFRLIFLSANHFIMGNLSCVSCKVKDKKIQKSIEELALSDFKGASFDQDAICDATNHTGSDRELVEEPARLSAQELYETLKARQIQPEDDDKLDDIEKAAKAIVDMSVFLTTQIIYPAYLRYLKEDHPDVYTQYFERPNTPLPMHYIAAEEHYTVDILDLRDVQPCLSCSEDYPVYLLDSDTSIPKKGDCR